MERDTTGRASFAADGPGDEAASRSEHPPFEGWLRRHALLIDSVLAIALFLYELMYLSGLYVVGGVVRLALTPFLVLVVSAAAMGVLYVLRRRAPLATGCVVGVLAWVYVAFGVGIGVMPLAVLALFLYFLGTCHGWKVLVPAVAAGSLWLIVATLPLITVGYIRIGTVGMMVLAYLLAAIIGALTRARRAHVAGLRESALRLARERDARARVASAEERARIARELHDIVSHGLGTMIVAADGARATVDTEPERAKGMMAQVRDTGRVAMSDMRRMLGVLRDADAPLRAPQPGLAQLDSLVATLRATGVRVEVRMAGEPRQLAEGLDLAAYRIVQEAVTNARTHGGPMLSLVRVEVAFTADGLEIRVTDDGRGSPGDAATQSGGHGLVGMRERVAAYDGELVAGPRQAGGFEVHATLTAGGEP